LDDDEPLPLENYLDVVDFKKVIENKQNWNYFKPLFNIPEPGEKGTAKNIKWFDRLNELRRIPAHPTETRHFKVEDFEYLDYLHEELHNRVDTFDINTIPESVQDNFENTEVLNA
jgi:hypothetical protein